MTRTMPRILTIVGARPQFIKAALVSEAMDGHCDEIVVHTGQHYDAMMSQAHFDDLRMRAPRHHLDVGSGSHGEQTAEMLRRLEPLVVAERPSAVLVYGDTNSTLAGALVAAKLNVPVAHVEAGLRSFNRAMPEEINRIVTDHLAQLLFAPTEHAAELLRAEGIVAGVIVVGDVMVDLVRRTAAALPAHPPLLDELGLEPGHYGVLTVHRASNTADTVLFAGLVRAAGRLGFPVVFPVHPRARPLIAAAEPAPGVRIVDPLPYSSMVALLRSARVLLTDSGGLQKEAYALSVPCVTLRAETEWTETLEDGWNRLAGTGEDAIVAAAAAPRPTVPPQEHYGDGHAARKVVDALISAFGRT